MLHIPNPDLLRALSRVPDPASVAGHMEVHRRTHLAALRARRRQVLARLWKVARGCFAGRARLPETASADPAAWAAH